MNRDHRNSHTRLRKMLKTIRAFSLLWICHCRLRYPTGTWTNVYYLLPICRADNDLWSLSDFSYNHPPMSPMTILRQSPTDPKWFEDNVNDFSLSSFLGQLDSTCDADKRKKSPNRDVSRNNIQSCESEYPMFITGFRTFGKKFLLRVF